MRKKKLTSTLTCLFWPNHNCLYSTCTIQTVCSYIKKNIFAIFNKISCS